MRNKPPSISKITRPAFSHVVARKRLFRLMDEGGGKQVLWVSGPAGSGKTTLVGSYLDARKFPSLWYRLDEGDDDIATFFHYMGLAAEKLAPKRKPLQRLTPEYLMGVPTFARRFFEALCERLKPPSAIVFDNYQDVPAAASFHEIIGHVLSAVPEGITVFVMSRTKPPQQLARLRANSRMRCFGWDDIRLNLVEAREIAKRTIKGKRLSVEDITDIYVKTSGWAAGVVLLTEGLNRGGIDHKGPSATSRQEVFDYFASEIFNTLDTPLQQFLLKTAFLPKIMASLAERLAGNADAERILRRLSHDNYFTEQHLQAQPVYIYHPLFREFLLSLARREMQPAEIRETQLSAARLLASEGQVEDAAELFIEAGDMEGLVKLILTEAQGLASQGRFRTLEGWLDKVPSEMRDAIPWLHFWKGVCRQTVSFSESRTNFEKAFTLFVAQDDKAGMLLSWSNVVDCLFFEGGDFTLLDRWADWMEGYINRGGTYPSSEIETQVAAGMASAYAWRRPGHPECGKWVERALQLAAGGHYLLQVKALASAILYYTTMGDLAGCFNIGEKAALLTRLKDIPPLLLVVTKLYEAWARQHNAEYYERAYHCVLEGLNIAEKNGIYAYHYLLNCHGVVSSFFRGDMAKAGEFLEALRPMVNRNHLNTFAQYHFLKAWFNLLAGRISEACSFADEAVRFVEASGTPFPEVLVRHVAALIRHEMGDHEAADTMLARAKEIAFHINSPYLIYLCLLDEAHFAFDRGNESAGQESLRKALEIGRTHEFSTISHNWKLSFLSRLCAKALEAGIETDYVKRFIKKCKLLPDAASVDSEHWPRPIKVYTLGRFGILKDDEPVKFSGKVQQKPLSLLKAVIAFGGRDVHEDRLIDALWPEADGDMAHSSLRTTTHRLRQLLGNDGVLQYSEGRLSLDPRYCWVDAWGFQRTAGEADNLWKKCGCGKAPDGDGDHAHNAIAVSERAVSLYKGDFLSGDAKYPWAFSARERLKSKFVRLVSRLGACHEDSGRWEKAIECYQRAIEEDGLQEEFYRRLMGCFQKMGRRSEALATFKRCRDELSSALGIEPSGETLRMYEVLRDGR